MDENNFTITLGGWISKANGFYQTARYLENPILEVKHNLDSITSSWYLLHHAIELFLKAILINYDKFDSTTSRIHDLGKLTERVSGLDLEIDLTLKEVKDNRNIEQWIRFINPFGSPNGGIRYNQPDKNLYAAPLGISYYFTNFVETVMSKCDANKEIAKHLLKGQKK